MSARTTGWVQPIVIDKTGTHRATIRAAAIASVRCWLATRDFSEWAAWLAGPFTKTVRRAKPAQVDWLALSEGWAAEHTETGAHALAIPPLPYTELPRDIARLQVSNTDLPREPGMGVLPVDEQCPVLVAVRSDLTTGKAAAQAAHALFAWALKADEATLAAFDAHPLFPLSTVYPDLLARVAARPGAVVIRDNGLTEVEPGTLTAVALRRTLAPQVAA